MRSFSVVTALAVGRAIAQPTQLEESIQKRQSGGLGGLLGGAGGFGGFPGGGGSSALSGLLSSAKSAGGSARPGKILGEEWFNKVMIGFMGPVANASESNTIGPLMGTFANPGYGPVAAPAGAAPKKVTEKTRIDVPGAKTVKIRYGPYKVPNMGKKNVLGDAGMLWNFPHKNLEKPCSGECTIMGMNAGLEYLDGSNANIDTGMWLHHMVLFNVGPGRKDTTCADTPGSLPHFVIGSNSLNSERIFASGNERTIGILPEWNVKDAGYKLKPTDSFAALVELMNENMEDKTVWLTMTYDIVDGHPFKDDVKVVWFDIRQCGTSEHNPPPGQSPFVLNYSWVSTIDAEVIGSIEHLHDGGARMTIDVDGKIACDSETLYGTKSEFIAQKHSMSGGHSHIAAPKHISEQKVCHGKTLTQRVMKKGQKWTAKAYYDFSKNPGNKHDGGDWEEVMGIAITFVRVKG